jgi:hypothetical protein
MNRIPVGKPKTSVPTSIESSKSKVNHKLNFLEVEMSEYTGEMDDGDDVSDATEVESLGSMNNYNILKEKTQKLKIIDDSASQTSNRIETSDEFLRNFFIKYGMKKSLDSFAAEWFELNAKSKIDKGLI